MCVRRAEVDCLQAGPMEETAKREDGSSSKSDRVALKKEIGLLTACAIIIGELGGGLPPGGFHRGAVTLFSENRRTF